MRVRNALQRGFQVPNARLQRLHIGVVLVVFARRYCQVLQAVVHAYAVQMVHDFVTMQRASYGLFHQVPMFGFVLAVNADPDVATVDESAALPCRIISTVSCGLRRSLAQRDSGPQEHVANRSTRDPEFSGNLLQRQAGGVQGDSFFGLAVRLILPCGTSGFIRFSETLAHRGLADTKLTGYLIGRQTASIEPNHFFQHMTTLSNISA